MTFCGWSFALDLANDENLIVRDPGLDFLLYFVEDGRQLGIYEGMHPQSWEHKETVDAGLPKSAWRLTKTEGEQTFTSYHVQTTERPAATILHIMSGSFDGTENDFELLKQFRYGSTTDTGCEAPTYETKS